MADTSSINKASERKKANVTIGTVSSGAIGAGNSGTSGTTSSASTETTSSATTTTNRGVKPSFLGIKDSDKPTYKEILQKFAATDFWHDFSHAKSTPVLTRLGKSYNVNSGLSVRVYQTKVLNLRREFIGATLYEMFQKYETKLMLLDGKANGLRYSSEDAVLDSLLPNDSKYNTIRAELLNKKSYINTKIGLHDNKNVLIGPTEQLKRSYAITAIQAKYPKENISISPSFEKVSGGTRNFILMIDASFLAISKILQLKENEKMQYNFYIIQSVENKGDPATKIGRFDPPQYPNVNVYFLTDIAHKTYYTPYTANGDDSNLLSDCTISAYHDSDGLITADIKSSTIDTTIDNIGTASEPNEAGFLAFQRLLIKGIEDKDEAFVYYLLKRAGDWCQALCLLDVGRNYTVSKWDQNQVATSNTIGSGSGSSSGSDIKVQSIADIIKEKKAKGESVEVALLTHDKILLSYALCLGLNVFYTIKTVVAANSLKLNDSDESSTSATWLTYFKNTLDSDPKAIQNAANQKWQSIEEDIRNINITLGFQEVEPTDFTNKISGIDLPTLDAKINEEYSKINQTCIKYINAAKVQEQSRYKKDMITHFITTIRIVLDLACKIGKKPEETLASLKATYITASLKQNTEPNEYFSVVSAIETKVHTYLQICKSMNQLLSFNLDDIQEGIIPKAFKDEHKKIQELENALQGGKPIVLSNKANIEPYQYFLFTTMPAIKKDLKTFIERFQNENEIKQALALEQVKYDVQGRNISAERLRSAWEKKRNTWFESYNEGIHQSRTSQGGGAIQTGGGKLEEIMTRKFIKTRERYDPTKNYSEFEEKSNPTNQDVVLDILNDYCILDVGTTITYNDGLGYTLLDDCILTKEEKSQLEKLILESTPPVVTNTTTSNSATTVSSNTTANTTIRDNRNKILYYRYLLLKLDEYTNKIHNVVLVFDDIDESGYSKAPYYTEDSKLYLQKIATCIKSVENFLISLNLYSLASLPDVLNEEKATVINQRIDINKDYLLTDIAILKEKLIRDYLSKTKIMEVGEGGAMTGRVIEKERENLDEYQSVRLYYLLCPSIENTNPYFTHLSDAAAARTTTTSTSTTIASTGENEYITLAKVFQEIHDKQATPSSLEPYKSRLKDHVLAYDDAFYKFAREALNMGEEEVQERKVQEKGAGAGASGREEIEKVIIQEKLDEEETEGEEAAGAGSGGPIRRKISQRLLTEKQKEALDKIIELKTGRKKRAIERQKRLNATMRERSRLITATIQAERRRRALQGQQAGGKRFIKTRSKPKIRKQTRRVQKKYRNKTKRVFKI